MMKKLIFFLAVAWINNGFCQTPVEALQEKLNAMHTLSAKFQQKVQAGKRQVSDTSGNMALLRPGHFRWETRDPMSQLVVADGKQLWIYDVDLEQVTVKKQGKSVGGTPGLFLSGNNEAITRDFNVTEEMKGNISTFDLRAKSNKENFQKVKLVFDGSQLRQIELFDQLGQHTVIRLSEVQMNPTFTEHVFQFLPPKGVDVIKQ